MDWIKEELTIILRPKPGREDGCFGWATPNNLGLFSSTCGKFKQFCVSPADFTFQILFQVDTPGMPRPPFSPPKLTVNLTFTDEENGIIFDKHFTDNNPIYKNPGDSLQTNFGNEFTINTKHGGILDVNLEMNDIDTEARVHYNDSIKCIIDPCV
ncbi:hypothetical protein COJ45_27855 [Bacillus cereus]|nr:hypothetical protein COJ45_27855 [Bacillus cereus]